MNPSEVLALYERHCDKIKCSGGSQYVALCPFHDDTHHSFSFNTDKTQYYCFGCDAYGNAVQFAKLKGENPKPFYSNNYQKPLLTNGKPTGKPPTKTEGKQKDKPSVDDGQMTVDLSNKAKEYFKNMPYKSDTHLISYQINSVGKDNRGSVTFPYYKDGKVIGIKHHKGKEGQKPYWEGDGKLKWYNEWYIHAFPKDKPLHLTEGEGDANRLVCIGINALSGSGGAGSIPPIPKVFREFKEIIILYDNDPAGERGAEKCAEQIYRSVGTLPYIAQWRKGLPKGFDASDDETGEEIMTAINNKRLHKPTESEGELVTMTISELIKSDYKAPEIIVRNIIEQESVSIISGCSGIGKSWLALNLGLSVASGKPFMGYFEISEPKKVLLVQFELTNGQVKERVELLLKRFRHYRDLIDKNFRYVVLDKHTTFTDRWTAIQNKLRGGEYDGGVVIVDNLYTSVDADVDTSNNQDLKPIASKWDEITYEHKVALSIITHHLKHRKRTPIDIDDVLGGAILSRFSSNIFQIKNSLLSTDLRVGMITKVRGEESQLLEIPFKLRFDDGYFTKGEIINNESLHYIEASDRWEIQLVKDMKSYEKTKADTWTRADIWTHLSTNDGWEKTKTNEQKITRFIKRVCDWGLMEKLDHNLYRIVSTDLIDV